MRVNICFKIFVLKNYDVKYILKIYFFKLGFKESKMVLINIDNLLEKKNLYRERNIIIIYYYYLFILIF